MSIDLSNDMQDAGVAESIEVKQPISEFFRVVEQDNKVEGSVLNYRSNVEVDVERPYSFNEVRDLSAPGLADILIQGEDGLTAEEIIQKEFNKNSSDGREQAILVEALRFGSQSALYDRLTKYRDVLEDNKHELSRVFNFSPLLLANGRVVPPVVAEINDMQMIEDQFTRRTVDKSYKIMEQARVVDSPINWRTYLYVDTSKPSMPSRYALPLKGNEREEAIWANGVSQGWEAGLKQANNIMIQNLRKLQSDYVGMVRYRIMLAKNMITSPIPSSINLGVTSNEDSLNIGEVIFEVVEAPKFNQNSETWKALPQIKSPIDF